jgi:hypothetical protein
MITPHSETHMVISVTLTTAEAITLFPATPERITAWFASRGIKMEVDSTGFYGPCEPSRCDIDLETGARTVTQWLPWKSGKDNTR